MWRYRREGGEVICAMACVAEVERRTTEIMRRASRCCVKPELVSIVDGENDLCHMMSGRAVEESRVFGERG